MLTIASTLSAHIAQADVETTQRLLDAHWSVLEDRCPTEAQALTNPESDRFFAAVESKLDVEGLELIWNESLDSWDENGRPYNADYHGMALVAPADVQSDIISVYLDYLVTGKLKDGEADPGRLFESARASTDLLKCLAPNDRERSEFAASDEKNYRLFLEAAKLLRCSNWIKTSEALIESDIAQAGTPEMEAHLSALSFRVFQDTDEREFKRCEEEYLQ